MRRTMPGTRENVEILVVAIVVAMGFRAYFLQPFKIPTGSMQPTLYGIHYEPRNAPGPLDQFPLSIVNRLVFGRVYTEVRAVESGVAVPQGEQEGMPVFSIGLCQQKIPRGLQIRFNPGDYVAHGQLLASGCDGERRPPLRGQGPVELPAPQARSDHGVLHGWHHGIQQGTYYIKRMVGLPTEGIGIDPPFIEVDSRRLTDAPAGIARVQSAKPPYAGYRLTSTTEFQSARDGSYLKCRLAHLNDTIHLAADQYLGFGDNTLNSLDGRYWGPVPERNLVGPSLLVYWPFSSRWGFTR